MKMIREIMSESEFYDIINIKRLVLVEFYAEWCSVCKMQKAQLIDFYQDAKEKVEVVSVDVDLLPKIANEYSVCTIPLSALFVNGKVERKKSGLTSKGNLAEMVIKYV